MNWPESTCVECGCKIPAGQIQRCAEGGYCTWRVPKALRALIKPSVPEEIRDLLWTIDGDKEDHDHNNAVIEAYRRGMGNNRQAQKESK